MRKKWHPFSGTSYGPVAVYVPNWGKPEAIELIMQITQNYPSFATHPVLDFWHNYSSGMERFDSPFEYRITPYVTDLERGYWSFLCLPGANEDIRLTVEYQEGESGRLDARLTFINPTDVEREFEISLFTVRLQTLHLENCRGEVTGDHRASLDFGFDAVTVRSGELRLRKITREDSNDWVAFPFNVEGSYYQPLPVYKDRYRERFKVHFHPMLIPARATAVFRLEFLPRAATAAPPPVFPGQREFAADELPWLHQQWQAVHNQEYIQSFNGPHWTNRVIPAPQWGDFWLWDSGFVAWAAADFDPVWAESIIAENPDPRRTGEVGHGAFHPTMVLGLFKLYANSGDRTVLRRHYPHCRALTLKMLADCASPDRPGMISSDKGSGSDDNPCSCYCKDTVFPWGYRNPLPRNPERLKLRRNDVELTAYALLLVRLLRLFAAELGHEEDVTKYESTIRAIEAALEAHWSEPDGCYLYSIVGRPGLLPIEWMGCFNPLFAGAVRDAGRQHRMLEKLTDTAKYWTERGLTPVPRDSELYRPDGYPNGSIWGPGQFYYWMAFYSIGRLDLATAIADRYSAMFEQEHQRTLMCWEHFAAETGHGTGNSRFSSFTLPVCSLRNSRRRYGYVQTGFNTLTDRREIDERGNARLAFRTPFDPGPVSVSIVLRPDRNYTLILNGRQSEIHSDPYGFIGLTFYSEAGQTTEIELKELIR